MIRRGCLVDLAPDRASIERSMGRRLDGACVGGCVWNRSIERMGDSKKSNHPIPVSQNTHTVRARAAAPRSVRGQRADPTEQPAFAQSSFDAGWEFELNDRCCKRCAKGAKGATPFGLLLAPLSLLPPLSFATSLWIGRLMDRSIDSPSIRTFEPTGPKGRAKRQPTAPKASTARPEGATRRRVD